MQHIILIKVNILTEIAWIRLNISLTTTPNLNTATSFRSNHYYRFSAFSSRPMVLYMNVYP